MLEWRGRYGLQEFYVKTYSVKMETQDKARVCYTSCLHVEAN